MQKNIVASILFVTGILFLLYPEISNIIAQTDLITKEMGYIISIMISLFLFAGGFSVIYSKKPTYILEEVIKFFYSLKPKTMVYTVILIFVLNFSVKFFLSFYVPLNFYYHDGAQYSSIALNIYKGNGFVSNSLWDVMLRHDTVPFEETSRPPLVPYVISYFYSVFGVSFFSEKLIFVLLSSMIPATGYVLFRKISNEKISILGSVILSFDWNVFTLSRVVHTELPFIFFGILFLLVLFSFKNRLLDYIFIGVTFGMAYLTRYQALYAFPLVILTYFYMESKSVKYALKRFLMVILIFTIVISPWLIRNVNVSGGPFSSDLPYLIVGAYGGRSFDYYVYSLDTVPETLFDVLLKNPSLVLEEYFKTLTGFIYMTPFFVFSNPLLFVFALMGVFVFGNLIKNKYSYTFFAYIIATYASLSVTLPVPRYLFNLIPVFVFFSSAGIVFLYENGFLKNVFNIKYYRPLIILSVIFVLFLNVLLISFAYSDLEKKGQSSLNTYNFFQSYLIPNKVKNVTLMVDSFPYFYDYYSRGSLKVLQFPYYTNEEDFYSYINHYKADYIVMHGDSILKIPTKIPDSLNVTEIYDNGIRTVYKINR